MKWAEIYEDVFKDPDLVLAFKVIASVAGFGAGIILGLKLLFFPDMGWAWVISPLWIPMVTPILGVIALAVIALLGLVGLTLWSLLILLIGTLVERAFNANQWRN